MDDGSRLPLIIVVLLLFCAMFFAVTETAFSASSRPRLKAMGEMGNKRAEAALSVLDNFDKAITTILICTNIVHLSVASIVTVEVTKIWGLSAVAISTIITTMVLFFAGEMLPKSIAKKFAEPLAVNCAAPLMFLMTVFSPFSAALSAVGAGVSKLIKGEPELSVTENELYDIIEDMTEEGTLDENQGELISSAIQFGDLTVESIITPRVDLVAVDVSSNLDDILYIIKSCGHSRLPAYEGSIDNIIGIIQIRKFIKNYLRAGKDMNIRASLDVPLFVHQSTNIDDLLPMMSRNKQNIAVITDNYGGTLGIVTIEDILEELVGDIWDEDDVVEEGITRTGDNELIAEADEHVGDVFEELSFEDPEDDEDIENILIGAWAYGKFTGIPQIGDSFDYHNLRVKVETMDHNRILSLRVTLLPEEVEGGENT